MISPGSPPPRDLPGRPAAALPPRSPAAWIGEALPILRLFPSSAAAHPCSGAPPAPPPSGRAAGHSPSARTAGHASSRRAAALPPLDAPPPRVLPVRGRRPHLLLVRRSPRLLPARGWPSSSGRGGFGLQPLPLL
ncbi:hypothetical protein VPH35_117089 [Triticum aestivum]